MLAHEGDAWYLAPPTGTRGATVEALAGASAGLGIDPASGSALPVAARHDPLALLAPRYRSGWLVVLELRDGTGAVRTLEVWADAVPPADFSRLHLACLCDVAPRASR